MTGMCPVSSRILRIARYSPMSAPHDANVRSGDSRMTTAASTAAPSAKAADFRIRARTGGGYLRVVPLAHGVANYLPGVPLARSDGRALPALFRGPAGGCHL